MAKVEFNAVGRRKKAVARVRLVAGDGKITINKRDIDQYFGLETLKMTVRQPLTLTNTGSFDVLVNVNGGGLTGQAGAIRHGISRALCKADPELRGALKKAGLLTRDPRMKERKRQPVVLRSSASADYTTALQNPCTGWYGDFLMAKSLKATAMKVIICMQYKL